MDVEGFVHLGAYSGHSVATSQVLETLWEMAGIIHTVCHCRFKPVSETATQLLLASAWSHSTSGTSLPPAALPAVWGWQVISVYNTNYPMASAANRFETQGSFTVIPSVLPHNLCSVHVHQQCAHSSLSSPGAATACLASSSREALHVQVLPCCTTHLSVTVISRMCCAHITTWTALVGHQL